MTEDFEDDQLLGRWVHSHEEDREGLTVFRPADHAFPPSRGRSGFELRADGVLGDVALAPADGPLESLGTWRRSGELLELTTPGGPTPLRVFEIVHVDAEQLIVRRRPPG